MRAVLSGLVDLVLLAPAALADSLLVGTDRGGLYLVDTQTLSAQHIAQTPQMFDIAVTGKGRIFGITGNGDLWRIEPMGGNVRIGNAGAFVNALVAVPAGGRRGAVCRAKTAGYRAGLAGARGSAIVPRHDASAARYRP